MASRVFFRALRSAAPAMLVLAPAAGLAACQPASSQTAVSMPTVILPSGVLAEVMIIPPRARALGKLAFEAAVYLEPHAPAGVAKGIVAGAESRTPRSVNALAAGYDKTVLLRVLTPVSTSDALSELLPRIEEAMTSPEAALAFPNTGSMKVPTEEALGDLKRTFARLGGGRLQRGDVISLTWRREGILDIGLMGAIPDAAGQGERAEAALAAGMDAPEWAAGSEGMVLSSELCWAVFTVCAQAPGTMVVPAGEARMSVAAAHKRDAPLQGQAALLAGAGALPVLGLPPMVRRP